MWQVNKGEPATCVQVLEGHTKWVDGLAFSPDVGALASASWDGTVKLWDTSRLSHGEKTPHGWWMR